MIGKKRKLINDPKADKFLLKLYEILNNEDYNKIIHWSKKRRLHYNCKYPCSHQKNSSYLFQPSKLFFFC